MKLFKRKKKQLTPEQQEVINTKDFFDMILPPTIKFKSTSIMLVIATDVYGL